MSAGQPTRLRLDIEGLRAIAVGAVLLYHLWPHKLPGGFAGVDIFFVISGFLITSHLLKRPPCSVRDLGEFWGRRLRRLLPASLTVLLVTVIVFRLWGPETMWVSMAGDAIAATFYVSNWRFAADSVDYLAAEGVHSPIQHFWSLSVEEQFYLVWPLLILAVWLASRRNASRFARNSSWTIAAVVVIGFAFSVYYTNVESAAAYFVTPTRIWQLALGGLVGCWALSGRSLRRGVSNAAASLGLVMIAGSLLFLDGSRPYPGIAAVFPTVGTALVIVAALSPRSILGRVLGAAPLVWVGGISYSLYLWHWPIIVLVDSKLSHRPWWLSVLLLMLSLVLAWCSKNFIEDPLRRPRGKHPLRLTYVSSAVAMVLVASLATAVVVDGNQRAQLQKDALTHASTQKCFGAKSLSDPSCDPLAPAVSTPAAAERDKPPIYEQKCLVSNPYTVKTCTFGSGKIRIAVVGNSHAGQWVNPLALAAQSEDWTVTTYLAAGCTASDALLDYADDSRAENCKRWGADVRKATSGNAYDLVITTERNVQPVRGQTVATSQSAWRAGYASYLEKWAAAKTPVLVIHDTPFPGATGGPVPDCLANLPGGAETSSCDGARSKWVPNDPLYTAAAEIPGIRRVDLSDSICLPSVCPAIVGGVIVYFDQSHLSASYSGSMTEVLTQTVREHLSR